MRIALSDLNGKRLALLLTYVNEDLESSAAVITGTAELNGSIFSLHRGPLVSPIHIPGSLLPRIQGVPEDLGDIFQGCQHYLQVTVGELALGAKRTL